jgi:predicted nucleic acid-binding protein
MNLEQALGNARRIFLDTAPVIYFIERGPFSSRVSPLFERLQSGALTAVTSPVTLTECLVLPVKTSSEALLKKFAAVIVRGPGVEFVPLDEEVAHRAAEVRVRHGLRLMDAFQVATALAASCDALITNDASFRRVTEIPVVLVSDLTE